MYVLEINPPLDRGGDEENNNVTMMPACTLDGRKDIFFKPAD